MTADHDPNSLIPLSDRLKIIRRDFQLSHCPSEVKKIDEKESWLPAEPLLDRFKVFDKLSTYQQIAWNGAGDISKIYKEIKDADGQPFLPSLVVGLKLLGLGKSVVCSVVEKRSDGGYMEGGFGERYYVPYITYFETRGKIRIRKIHSIQFIVEKVDPLRLDSDFELYASSLSLFEVPGSEQLYRYARRNAYDKAIYPERLSVKFDQRVLNILSPKRLIACEYDLDEFLSSDYQNRLAQGEIPIIQWLNLNPQ